MWRRWRSRWRRRWWRWRRRRRWRSRWSRRWSRRWRRMTSMTICRQKTVPGVLRLLRIVVNSPGCAIQNNNTNTYNTHTIKIQNIHFSNPNFNSGVWCIWMYLMYCYVSLCDPSSPIVLRTCSKSCIVVVQLHRLYCVVLFVL